MTDFTGAAPTQATNAWGAGVDFDQSQPQQPPYHIVADTKADAETALTALTIVLPAVVIITIGAA